MTKQNKGDLVEYLRGIFVSIERFSVIEKIVYGACGIILVAFVTAIVAIVIRK
jgi:hypothetical protein